MMAGWTLISSVPLITCILLQLCAAHISCRGRCGEPFLRGQICTCDDDCLAHNECCKDYEDICTSRDSCKGRCQEAFRRGRECECDPDCTVYNSCCPDYSTHCDMNYSAPEVRIGNTSGEGCVVDLLPLTKAPTASTPAEVSIDLPLPPANPVETTAGPLFAGTSSPVEPLTAEYEPINDQTSGNHNQPSVASETTAGRPTTLEALEAANTAGQSYQSLSPDLCSGHPITGVTASFNGSIIVFRGHFFWILDPKTRAAGPAHNISEDLGIPSPIDTAFTRCNCEGRTYIIKGGNYWSFQNGVMVPGYPRSVLKDFGGLSGGIVAVLSVPATRNKPEAVYFFRKGGTVQKLTYPAGSGPTCTGKKVKNPISAKNPVSLSGEINITMKWRGFPTPVTSALSLSNPRKPDGFDHYVISWPKIFSIKISGEIPVLASPANDVRNWLSCPQ